ncbi:LLM class flavin-dependent oxidoreductase [Pseudarthrobacter sp. TAF60_1]|uniref:LLM class flavin-dependent oxidoreductase n=1 Tax=Pseudarthrobacter sp. TAF60_1 TaxID=3233071 RepID=UPI003F9CA54F
MHENSELSGTSPSTAVNPTAPVPSDTILLGVSTFGDVDLAADGAPKHHAQVLRQVVEQAKVADAVGLHSFGVGEHHRKDFAVSAPEVVLAAIATATENIRLGSAVTVLSSDDPIRVFQRFATLDALSNGRAEVILGRGSFTESFPLFGHDLADYEVLFEEKLDLYDRVRSQKPVNWDGRTRASLRGQMVYPHVEGRLLPTWIGVGGSPQSVVRTATYGYPMVLAIIGGEPERFRPYVDLYKRTLAEKGHDPQALSVHSPGYVADTDEQALEEYYSHWLVGRNKIGAERGWGPAGRGEFEAAADEDGALFIGSPKTVAEKIVRLKQTLGADRFEMKFSGSTLPHGNMLRSIELFGTEVAPLVADMLAGS